MSNRNFPPPIVPAKITYRNGTLYSETYGDVYHSAEGGLGQAHHVFLEGNELPIRWKNGARFTIVETGFGCGLNFLATCDLLYQSGMEVFLDYVSVEKHPFAHDDLWKILRCWPKFNSTASALLDKYPPLLNGFHRLHINSRVSLTLLFGDALELLGELDARADAFYLDGFAPALNTGMWSNNLLKQIARLAVPGATAATYSASGAVRRGLEHAGFAVEKSPGFGRKREMLVARFPGTWCKRSINKNVIVIGAGIAGLSCAHALARRGIDVEVLDRAGQCAAEASSNPAALVRPFLTLDTSVRSRFSWSAFLYAVRAYRALDGQAGFSWKESGVLQLAQEADHRERLTRALGLHQFPRELARLVEAEEGTRLCGADIPEPGVWFSMAGYLNGRNACRAFFENTGPSMHFTSGIDVASVERDSECVRVLDANKRVVASGDDLVLANGNGAQALAGDRRLYLSAVRGQLTALPGVSVSLRAPVSRDGYVAPETDGVHYVGSSYDVVEPRSILTAADRSANMARAANILPAIFPDSFPDSSVDWAGVRCVSRDYLPVIGPLLPRVHLCLALASRGFSWGPLAGDMVASHIVGDASPVEKTISDGVLAHRFLALEKRSQ